MPPALTLDILTDGTVSVDVDPDHIPFDVHIELTCSCSPFFDKALNGRFEEAFTDIIELPNDEPEAFADLVAWLYNGSVVQSRPLERWDHLRLSKLWVLADKLCVSQLQNDVMAHLVQSWRTTQCSLHFGIPQYVYQNTLPESKLQRMTVDMCAWGMDERVVEIHRNEMPPESLADLALVLMRRSKRYYACDKPPFEFDMKHYLVPDNGPNEAGPQAVNVNTQTSEPNIRIKGQLARRRTLFPKSRLNTSAGGRVTISPWASQDN